MYNINNSRIIIEELDGFTDPIEVFDLLSGRPYCFMLDSSLTEGKLGICSVLGSDPFLIFRSKGDEIEIIREGRILKKQGDSLACLKELLDEYKTLPNPLGAFGYFGYDFWETLYKYTIDNNDELDMWDINLGFYDTIISYDHGSSKAQLISVSDEKIEEVRVLLGNIAITCDYRIHGELRSNFTCHEYSDAIERVRHYIRDGDVYQINLSQKFTQGFTGNPYGLYKKLRVINPAPFSAYLNFDDEWILSCSPERFLKVEGKHIETRPIKGTRPRGLDVQDDIRLQAQLSESVKDQAEHLMIVDLERNDLGRICEYGSVKVSEFEIIEEYATVHHMVSTVEGIIRDNIDPTDIIKATFPGGSITGAPKVRAMEIISELEPDKRGIYTGSIGRIGFNGNMDLNIVIRTLVIKDNKVHIQVGGGIVYDSTPEGEYQETLDKAKALFEALEE